MPSTFSDSPPDYNCLPNLSLRSPASIECVLIMKIKIFQKTNMNFAPFTQENSQLQEECPLHNPTEYMKASTHIIYEIEVGLGGWHRPIWESLDDFSCNLGNPTWVGPVPTISYNYWPTIRFDQGMIGSISIWFNIKIVIVVGGLRSSDMHRKIMYHNMILMI